MSTKTDLPPRAEDAVAKLKRSREHTSSPETKSTEKRARTEEAAAVLANTSEKTTPQRNDTQAKTVYSTSVLNDVASFDRRDLGSVIYEPKKLIVQGHELQFNCILRVKISHQFLTKELDQFKQRALWGTDVYTDDSDLVVALYHLGLLPMLDDETSTKKQDLQVDILLLPPLVKYQGTYRNNFNSRTWLTHHDGISYMVLGRPKTMAAGWAHSGKDLLYMRFKALKELREYDPRDIAYT